ncbi:glycine betaine ABC transporter substrate-binding protein [Halalkalibacter hemicellulosilyticus]|uniref:Glycine betaine ABC transport system n=1 Tax=Halalkalibacter hemicellulosilyticusJCM 9152 TaxID=1236971 RepID=W4QLI4_9BACI|nr:glycine betaine ABC transporter substrate-binding protein [Halalkalibacter hemicellulosilyticus]GAE32970.1 glycine betaine ABC transport system [Halalkalibacter hemicellulosilyticusJCM 9152]
MLKKLLGVTTATVFALGLVACGSDEPVDGGSESEEPAGEGTEEATGFDGASVDYQIVGIDPGAGLMNITINDVLPEYGLEDDWTVVESSSAAMVASLTSAYENEEPIIVTGWSPHFKFNNFDLKYLEDPLNIYGDTEDIHTVVRLGLDEDQPEAYQFLSQFQWEPEHIEYVMALIAEGTAEEAAAEQFVEENEELVATWTDGVEAVEGEELELLYVAWEETIAATNVVGHVLETLGFDVTLTQIDAGPMWAGIASGSGDAIVCAWLPTTHAEYYAEYEGQFEDLGSNLHGTQLGLAVPTYMEDIHSIEDLVVE